MKPTLIHHAANCGGSYPSGSLAAVQACVSAGVRWVEVDLIPLADNNFVLCHEVKLETVSNGAGLVTEKTAADLDGLYYRNPDFSLSAHPISTLGQMIEWVTTQPSSTQLQLDLKPYAPLNPSVLESLLKQINPVRERVLISSVADWAVRLLRHMDPGAALGFDPLLYLDLETETARPDGVPPLRVGAYGVRDEHPLSIQRWGSDDAYFAARAEALYQQAPSGSTWYLNAGLLEKVLAAGFDWISFLHQRGSRVSAWTLDKPQIELIRRLIHSGIDMITTNQANQLYPLLEGQVVL